MALTTHIGEYKCQVVQSHLYALSHWWDWKDGNDADQILLRYYRVLVKDCSGTMGILCFGCACVLGDNLQS